MIPDLRERLAALARNLWWTWNHDAQRLFAAIDPVAWDACSHDPSLLLNGPFAEQQTRVAADPAFMRLLAACESNLRRYLSSRTWFDRAGKSHNKRRVFAYFCAEFAIHESLPLYSGGLGVLAGDHLKSASDLGVPLVAVGLFYRHGYYKQQLAGDGATSVVYPTIDPARSLAYADTGKVIAVPVARRLVKARIWKLQVGRVPLYLLDTNLPANKPADRRLTDHLYGGDREYRIQQEILLGVGGVRALAALGIAPAVYHLNEGHAAFCALERLRQLRRAGVACDSAIHAVRRTTVFTTHTPVPAGHDRFPHAMMRKYFPAAAADLGLGEREFFAFGRENAADKSEEFCMTVLALRLSARCNGVSKLHGEVTRKMWERVCDSMPEKTAISHVTNGIHSRTWLAPLAIPLYEKYLKPRWDGAGPDDDWWKNADRIPDAELRSLRGTLRRHLVRFVRQRLIDQARRRAAAPAEIESAARALHERVLTIGFARRFATYKRATLIFRDPARLAAILNHPKRPVQLVFAGKAHPRDLAGQKFAQTVFRFSRRPEFAGKIVLLENYDMELGRVLTAGCDVWLNNPTRPQEASGTSGMKPPLHGGINCSILDGWWPECFDGRNGWAIGDGRDFASAAKRDSHDATCIHDLLENEIAPRFYARSRAGVPSEWVRTMKASMKSVCAKFSTHRMVSDYVRDYYIPAASRRTGK